VSSKAVTNQRQGPFLRQLLSDGVHRRAFDDLCKDGMPAEALEPYLLAHVNPLILARKKHLYWGTKWKFFPVNWNRVPSSSIRRIKVRLRRLHTSR
jgi:hypothetical protein